MRNPSSHTFVTLRSTIQIALNHVTDETPDIKPRYLDVDERPRKRLLNNYEMKWLDVMEQP
jgi:hypothetical protein